MSGATPIPSAWPVPVVRQAIAQAAQATGTDFSFLLGEAHLESRLDPNARAGTSSAAGLFQFTRGTWLAMLDRHGARHGLDWAGEAINRGDVSDPALRDQILALRYDPRLAALMAGELAGENRQLLAGVLGREPDASELYLAHFLGGEGAGQFLRALASDPQSQAATLFPKAAAANRAIFFDDAGQSRSLASVMGLIRERMAGAMEAGGAAPAGGPATWPGSADLTGARHAAQPQSSVSMAETLASAFGQTGQAMPAHVRQAYARLQALGL